MKLSIITLVILLIYIVIDRIEKAYINKALDSFNNYCDKVNDWTWSYYHGFCKIASFFAKKFEDFAEFLISSGFRIEGINEEDKEETK